VVREEPPVKVRILIGRYEVDSIRSRVPALLEEGHLEQRATPGGRHRGLGPKAQGQGDHGSEVSRITGLRGEATGAVYVTVQARLTGHFLRRLEERGGDLGRLLVEGEMIVAEGWLRAVHDHDFSLVVPGFGQIRIRVDRFGGGGFVAVTFLPQSAS
jgi:hypothetical protein